MRDQHVIETVVRGKNQITHRTHTIPKSYGKKFNFLAHLQKLKIMKMWVLISEDLRKEYLTTARLAMEYDAAGALAAKVHNTHSDEMARICHILIHPGAASLVTATWSTMERDTLDLMHLGSDTAKLEANPYYQLVMEFYNDPLPNSDFNKRCFK